MKRVIASTPEEVLERLAVILKDQLSIPREEVTREAKFVDDLGLDDLDVLEVTMALEEEFGMEIDDADAAKLLTVGAAVDYLVTRVADMKAKFFLGDQ